MTYHVELLRKTLKSAPALANVDRQISCQAFFIFSDSSSLAIGALLCQNVPIEKDIKTSSLDLDKPCPGKKNSQGDETFLRPISYFSQSLSKAEQHMDIASLELYTTVRSLEHLLRFSYWGPDTGARLNMRESYDEIVGSCSHCNFMARNKRMNTKKSFKLLHQTLSSSCRSFISWM